MKAERITKEELAARIERGDRITLLDVRNPFDYQASDFKLPGAVRIPVAELEARAGELDTAVDVAAYCT